MAESLSEVAGRLYRSLGDIVASPVLSEGDDPLSVLRAVDAVQAQAATLLATAVARARSSGATWQQVGDVLGVSRQAAFQRFGRPIDPRTGAVMNTTPLAGTAELAADVIDALAAGEWSSVVDRFDEQMRQRLNVDGLAAAWAQIVGTAGAFERRGETSVARAADVTITNTPLAFEAGDFIARVTFRDDSSIAGLFILPANAA